MTEQTERALLEARVRATNYMREWWSQCDRTEREQGTGIAWLADHVLHVAGLPELLAKVEDLRAEIVWLNRRMLEMGDDAERALCESQSANRYREALTAIETYARPPHQEIAEACGVDACTACLIHGTAREALDG